MANETWEDKAPSEVDYRTCDWSAEVALGAMTGTPTATVILGDVVVDSTSYSNGVQTVWLSGGTDGTLCRVKMTADFADGRTDIEVVGDIWIRSN